MRRSPSSVHVLAKVLGTMPYVVRFLSVLCVLVYLQPLSNHALYDLSSVALCPCTSSSIVALMQCTCHTRQL